MEPRITLAVVDDHPLFRGGVVHALSADEEFDVVGEGASSTDAVSLVSNLKPTVLLLDMKLPGGGLETIEAILAVQPRTNILMLTVVDDEQTVARAFKCGARGYLLKGAGRNELIETVRSVARGDLCVSPELVGKLLGRISETHDHKPALGEPSVDFTEREEQILSFLSCGLSNKEMAFRLELSEKTIKYYVTHVLRKLHVRNRVEAALYASHRVSNMALPSITPATAPLISVA